MTTDAENQDDGQKACLRIMLDLPACLFDPAKDALGNLRVCFGIKNSFDRGKQRSVSNRFARAFGSNPAIGLISNMLLFQLEGMAGREEAMTTERLRVRAELVVILSNLEALFEADDNGRAS